MHNSFRELKPRLTPLEFALIVNRTELMFQMIVPEFLADLVLAAGTLRTRIRTDCTERVTTVTLVDRDCEVLGTTGTSKGCKERRIRLQLALRHYDESTLCLPDS